MRHLHAYVLLFFAAVFIFSGHVNVDTPYGLSDLKFYPLQLRMTHFPTETEMRGTLSIVLKYPPRVAKCLRTKGPSAVAQGHYAIVELIEALEVEVGELGD
jgi:hypothetical protein